MTPTIVEVKDSVRAAARFIGVVPPLAFQTLSMPKRLLLMFDQLALDLNGNLTLLDRRILERAAPELRWLGGEGLLTTLGGAAAAAQPRTVSPTIRVEGAELLGPLLGRRLDMMGRAGHLARVASQGLRQTAADLRSRFGVDAVAVPETLETEDSDSAVTRDTVVRITLREFPSPSDVTPWEAIKDFRQDPEARAQFARLKAWMNRTGRSGLKEYEVADELQWMIHEYESQMKLHKLKASKSMLEIVITTTAEIAEGLVKFRWSESARALFDLKKQKVQLLTEEKGCVGREIAYIPTLRGKFA